MSELNNLPCIFTLMVLYLKLPDALLPNVTLDGVDMSPILLENNLVSM